MSTANLAPNVSDERVSAPASPLDAGLSLEVWQQRDPGGFFAAARNAIDADALIELAADLLLQTAPRLVACPDNWRENMHKLLAAEVSRGAPWVSDWQNRFYEEE
jgi:hypothetical protein